MSERLEHLESLIGGLLGHSGSDISRADIDEIQYLAITISSELPQSFLGILNNFNTQPYYGSEAPEVIDRLDRLLAISKKYPSGDISTALSEELLPTFKLDQDDKSKVLQLCQQMREIINQADFLDDPHRRRLLRRISGIEHQVHQPKGILDVIRGGVSDVGETLGKFGEDIKPLTERMSEINQIARRNAGEYDQLPAPEEIKQLPAPEDVRN